MKESGFPGRLEKDGEDFMMMLEQIDGPGRYFSCMPGRARHGESFEPGPSCFALKILYTFGWWSLLSNDEQKEWIRCIESFALSGEIDVSSFIGAYIGIFF